MPWYVWISVGAGITLVCLVALGAMVERRDNTAAVQRQRAIRMQRDAAEQRMQAAVQDTVSQLFAAARVPR